MTEEEIRSNAFAMPLHCPSYPPGPYRFFNREFLIITYRSDPERLRQMVPAPLELAEPVVKYEFIRMPDSAGFGCYCESGQTIPVTFKGTKGTYVHAMYLNDHAPIAGGRELWGFPKKLGQPELRIERETLVGTLDFGGIRVATGTMGYKHRALGHEDIAAALEAPAFVLKIIPHVDGSPRILELVRYYQTDVVVKSAWGGPAALDLRAHALAPLTDLPVLEVHSAVHILTDMTLGLGEVVHDYLSH